MLPRIPRLRDWIEFEKELRMVLDNTLKSILMVAVLLVAGSAVSNLRASAGDVSPVSAAELSAAKAAYEKAFAHYTQLATSPGAKGNRQEALKAYQAALARYRVLQAGAKPTAEAAKPRTVPLKIPEGMGIVEIDAPASIDAPAPKDKTVAMAELAAKAKAGNNRARETLALLYRTGHSGPPDPYRAIELLRQAADAGHADAMAQLADVYEAGVWVAQDPNKARALRVKAAKFGSRLAQWELESHE